MYKIITAALFFLTAVFVKAQPSSVILDQMQQFNTFTTVLYLAAHPDDAELSCAGTILSYIMQGKKVGIVDFTRGEMATRGTPEIRLEESNEATKILGLHARENLGLADGFFQNDQASQLIF